MPEVFDTRLKSAASPQTMYRGMPRPRPPARMRRRHPCVPPWNERGVSASRPANGFKGHTMGGVLVFQDVTDLQNAARTRPFGHHDALTGLPNRSAFGRALTESTRASPGRRLALCSSISIASRQSTIRRGTRRATTF